MADIPEHVRENLGDAAELLAYAVAEGNAESVRECLRYVQGNGDVYLWFADGCPGEGPKDLGAVELGRRGGPKGGLARARALSRERRREIASLAARARWDRRTPRDGRAGREG